MQEDPQASLLLSFGVSITPEATGSGVLGEGRKEQARYAPRMVLTQLPFSWIMVSQGVSAPGSNSTPPFNTDPHSCHRAHTRHGR